MEITAQVAAANAQAAREQAKLAKEQRRAEILKSPKVQNSIDELLKIIDITSKDGATSCYKIFYNVVREPNHHKLSIIIWLVFVFIVLPVLFFAEYGLMAIVPFGVVFLLGYLLVIAHAKNSITEEELECVGDELNRKGFHAYIEYTGQYVLHIDWSNSGSPNE